MAQNKRTGQRKSRSEISSRRIPKLGYYFIVTDTKETEQNYMFGLRDSIPNELKGKLVIKVVKTKTVDLVNEANNLASLYPQYGEPWIIFDRDQVKDFDKIITEAESKGINVGWSNPCIEIWFSAYFGAMPTYQDSVSCCSGFEKKYEQVCTQRYIKSDPELYLKLCRYGNEELAIGLAEQKLESHYKNGFTKPADMCPASTVYKLIKEIKNKIAD